MIPVVWLNFHPDAPNRGYWDQGLLVDLFAGDLWKPAGMWHVEQFNEFPGDEANAFCVFVIPARQNAEYINEVNAELMKTDACLVILTGDEEGTFPVEMLAHDQMRVWVMSPQKGRKYPNFVNRFLGCGYPTAMRQTLKGKPYQERDKLFFFSGQITHDRRTSCADALEEIEGGELHRTDGFTKGMDQKEYWDKLTEAKWAPAPGGPVSPDSFRLFEALEAGAIPIGDNASGREFFETFWHEVFGGEPGFPRIGDWNSLQVTLQLTKPTSAQVFAWWQAYKRDLAIGFFEDCKELSGRQPRNKDMRDRTTVLIPTSPIPSNPDTSIIEETVESIRSTEGLENVEILIMADYPRADAPDEAVKNYEEYLDRLTWLCNAKWRNVLPIIFTEHSHQGAMTRKTLEQVRTRTILFVEHDTPLVGDFEWQSLYQAINSGLVHMIRFHHETTILEPHEYLMMGDVQEFDDGVRLRPTIQWSQRPHLADADVYRRWMKTYFGWQSRTMIEDVMYGVLENANNLEGWSGWDKFRLYIYHPLGDSIKRSTHTDGRGDWPKGDMLVQYDTGEQPNDFAPHPGLRLEEGTEE